MFDLNLVQNDFIFFSMEGVYVLSSQVTRKTDLRGILTGNSILQRSYINLLNILVIFCAQVFRVRYDMWSARTLFNFGVTTAYSKIFSFIIGLALRHQGTMGLRSRRFSALCAAVAYFSALRWAMQINCFFDEKEWL